MLNIASETVALMLRLLVETSVIEQGMSASENLPLTANEQGTCKMEELDGNFYIQAFSSPSHSKAMKYTRRLTGDVVTYLSGNGDYVVLLGPYPSYNGAHKELPYQLKNQQLPKDSFITQLSGHQVLRFLC